MLNNVDFDERHFEWDDAKAESHLSKHSVSFEAATAPPRF